MSSATMPGSFLSAIGRTKASLPSAPFFGPHPEVDQVVPVEGRVEEGGRARRASEKIAFASPLASKCGTLYLPWRVGMRVVLERAPTCACPRGWTRRRAAARRPSPPGPWSAACGQLLLRGEVVPEEGDAEGAVGARGTLAGGSRRRRRRRPRPRPRASRSSLAFSAARVTRQRARREPPAADRRGWPGRALLPARRWLPRRRSSSGSRLHPPPGTENAPPAGDSLRQASGDPAC